MEDARLLEQPERSVKSLDLPVLQHDDAVVANDGANAMSNDQKLQAERVSQKLQTGARRTNRLVREL